ncbi:MAG: hypothetical protein JW849_05800 [Phycisphaerae bacterium]|nr:hypothetical protein [Phycisphaerae bacterium]
MSQIEVKDVRAAMEHACHWLVDIAQIQTDELPADTDNRQGLPYESWRGSIRGEYSAADKTWWSFCPIWHTGQAVRALTLASQVLGQDKWLTGAKLAAEFIYTNQIFDESNPSHGLILAYEDNPTMVNTSAVMECMEGLMQLANAENDSAAWDRIIAAGDFLVEKMFMPEVGLFRDVYDPASHSVLLPNPYRSKDDLGGRPLIDDGVLVRLYERTKDRKFLDAHLKISDRLVADQRPKGNWIDYGPCHAAEGRFHPRHTYWWGKPLLDSYHATGDARYLETAIASGEFTARAMRRDGGYIRNTFTDFNTDSFGHVTSGSACAAILFLSLFRETKESKWMEFAERAISFCMNMQLIDVQDRNLEGVILEKVLPPVNHTDASPYYIRDVGTIFFVTAAAEYLKAV